MSAPVNSCTQDFLGKHFSYLIKRNRSMLIDRRYNRKLNFSCMYWHSSQGKPHYLNNSFDIITRQKSMRKIKRYIKPDIFLVFHASLQNHTKIQFLIWLWAFKYRQSSQSPKLPLFLSSKESRLPQNSMKISLGTQKLC